MNEHISQIVARLRRVRMLGAQNSFYELDQGAILRLRILTFVIGLNRNQKFL
jgi:hypothetical protein